MTTYDSNNYYDEKIESEPYDPHNYNDIAFYTKSKILKIRSTNKGYYINFKGKRYYLDNFVRCGTMWQSPITLKNLCGDRVEITGIYCSSYYYGYILFIQILNDEQAILYYR